MQITTSKFSCKRDNLTIRGTEYRPQGDNLPIAIVCHGFMAFQATVKKYAKIIASCGYLTYTFDFCGGSILFGKSDGRTDEMSVLTEVEDLESVVEYALSKEYSKKTDILLMGCSQGGFVAALLAAKHKYDVTKLALFYPAFCIPDDARQGKMMLAKFNPEKVPETIWCGPMKLGSRYVTDVIDMDAYKEIEDYDKDVLIIHGTEDTIVDTVYTIIAYETFFDKNRNRAINLKFIRNGGHGFFGKKDKAAIERLKFFISRK